MRRPLTIVLTALAVLTAAAACDDVEYVAPSGTVTYKEHVPAESWTECGYDLDWDGKYRYGCDTGWESECYLVEFSDGEWDYEDCTSKAVFDAVAVGDPYIEGQAAPG